MSAESLVCPVALFDAFVGASTFKGILQTFNQICGVLQIDPFDHHNFYAKLKSKLTSWKAQKLWSLLDKRAAQKEYKKQKPCQHLKVLVIGSGPCGLRSAIECALLGAKVVLVEKRDRFSRNNVLHIWPFVIHDLRNLGAKLFYPRFCAGSLDHISIIQLQCILLKAALVLGVEVHEGISFEELEPPSQGVGWHATFKPENHYLCEYDFDAIISADGKRNTLPGFPRRELRGKLAIGVTANFVNRKTPAEERVPEISGVAFIFNQQFFKDMREQTGIDLENIVYYKDETHYFVMCAKKPSLLDKGVLKNDSDDVQSLLKGENINQTALLSYAREAADFATEGALPNLDYSSNHNGRPDVAMFDFTSLFSAENSCRMLEKNGYRLMMAIVGDSLHEPFWPTGSGCARGFLGIFDTIWLLRSYGIGNEHILQLIAERESAYRLLAQTTPENLNKNIHKYTIDPRSRYPSLEYSIRPEQVEPLFFSDRPISDESPPLPSTVLSDDYLRRQRVIRFCQSALQPYRLRVDNLTSSWADGKAICALMHRFRPEIIDFDSLKEERSSTRWGVAVDLIKSEYNLLPPSEGQQDHICQYLELLLEKFTTVIQERVAQALSAKKESPARQKPKRKVPQVKQIVPEIPPQVPTISDNETEKFLNEIGGELTEEQMKEILSEWSIQDDVAQKELSDWRDKRASKKIEQMGEFLFGSNSKVESYSSAKSPVSVEKLQPERIMALETLVSGELEKNRSKDLYAKKRRQADIKTRKLDKKEVEEMETKLETTAMGSLLFDKNRRDKIKTMSSQDEKMIRAKTASVRRIAEEGFLEQTERFDDFDRRLKQLENKLGDANKTGLCSVAALTAQHTQKVHPMPKKAPVPLPNSKPTTPDTPSPRPLSVISPAEEKPNKTNCSICGKRVYLAERICVEGQLLHKACFRCGYCNAPLRLGNCGFDRSLGANYQNRFFCIPHLNIALPEKLSKLKIRPKIVDQSDTAPRSPLPQVRVTRLNSPGTLLARTAAKFNFGVTQNTKTPERAEFASCNSDTSEEEDEVIQIQLGHSDDESDSEQGSPTREASHSETESSGDDLCESELRELEHAMAQSGQGSMTGSLSYQDATRLANSWKHRKHDDRDDTSGSGSNESIEKRASSAELRERKRQELEAVRANARAKARLKSDDELGLTNIERQGLTNTDERGLTNTEGLTNIQTLGRSASLEENRTKEIDVGRREKSVPDERSLEAAQVQSESHKETSLLDKMGAIRYKKRRSRSPSAQVLVLPRQNSTTEYSNPETQNETRETPPKAHVDETVLSGEESLGDQDTSVSESSIRRVQKAAERLVRQQEQQRGREAQEIHRKLQEIDVKLAQVQTDGKALETKLQNDPKNGSLLSQWLLLCNELEELRKTENELKLRSEELRLQEKHSKLTEQLRPVVTGVQLQDEHRILEQLLLVVAERDALMSQMKREKSKIPIHSSDIEKILQEKGSNFSSYQPVFL